MLMFENRKSERFADFGRVECSDLCIVSGVLVDISASGCKVCFSAPADVDLEKEYEISLRLPRTHSEQLLLMVVPVWSKNVDGKTLVGFSIIHSKDSARLDSYIKMLKEDKRELSDELVEQEDTSLLFV